MFELILLADSITSDGGFFKMTDGSVWANADYARNLFGVFLKGEYKIAEEPSAVTFNTYDPLTDVDWTVVTPDNGRYTFTAYAFVEIDTEVPAEGDVHVHATTGVLYQWVSAAWVEISLDDAIAAEKAYYTSAELDIPFLAYAYTYKNTINLEYIQQVKADIQNGASQNKLYYKRTDLDYVDALITGAEYNWAIGLFSNYYEVVSNLNSIISTGKIS